VNKEKKKDKKNIWEKGIRKIMCVLKQLKKKKTQISITISYPLPSSSGKYWI